jgi:hypothetical protein
MGAPVMATLPVPGGSQNQNANTAQRLRFISAPCIWSASKCCFLAADGHRVAQTPYGDIYRLLSLGQGVQFCTRERMHSSLHVAPLDSEHVKEVHSMGLSDAGGSARIASRP